MLKNDKGFTLIEMMIVLLVISVLLIVTIPNITNNNSTINNKGCDALIKMVEAQVQAYSMEYKKMPSTITELKDKGYLGEGQTACPNGKEISISQEGKVSVVQESEG